MRRVIAVVLTGIMTIGMMYVGTPKEDVEEKKIEVIETQTPIYLTDYELSKLYTLRKEVRHKDKIDLTQDEAQLLMAIGRSEGGDTLEGQLWTMRVLINRIESDRSDFQDVNTLGEVAYQKNQFDVITNGSYKWADINEYTHIALGMIEGGWDETDGSLWFESSSNSEDTWHKKKLTLVKEVQGQRYYK